MSRWFVAFSKKVIWIWERGGKNRRGHQSPLSDRFSNQHNWRTFNFSQSSNYGTIWGLCNYWIMWLLNRVITKLCHNTESCDYWLVWLLTYWYESYHNYIYISSLHLTRILRYTIDYNILSTIIVYVSTIVYVV